MKLSILLCLLFISPPAFSQELFVFTEPASNPAARSVNLKFSEHYFPFDRVYDRPAHRVIPELMVGITKKWMIAMGSSFSNMHTYNFKKESYSFYTKYRFLSYDDVHQHFRMAAFLQATHTDAPFHYDEVELTGDKSGIEAGVISTGLWNRFALSGSIAHVQVLDNSRYSETVYIPKRIYKAMNYSLSSGYLLLPKEYTSYQQVNVNVYVELLAQQALGQPRYFIDAAPAVQFIFFSNTKLNVGYRFQFAGNAQRMSKTSWLFSVERSFLNVWKPKSK